MKFQTAVYQFSGTRSIFNGPLRNMLDFTKACDLPTDRPIVTAICRLDPLNKKLSLEALLQRNFVWEV
jgi:hypothetical protein